MNARGMNLPVLLDKFLKFQKLNKFLDYKALSVTWQLNKWVTIIPCLEISRMSPELCGGEGGDNTANNREIRRLETTDKEG